MKLVIDEKETRTPDWEKIKKYLEDKEIEYEIKTLLVGDFIIDDSICVERKCISDFYASIRGDHLWRQTRNMRHNYKHNFIIISGNVAELYTNYHTKFILGAYLGALTRLAVMENMSVVQVENSLQLIDVIVRISKKIIEPVKNLQVERIRLSGKDVKLNIVMCIPGIGISKARIISAKYSIKQLCNCPLERLLKLKGIGTKHANEIKKYFE